MVGGGLWIACAGTGVSTGGRAHSSAPFFVVLTKESNTCVHVFLREIAWIRARPTTDRDLESQRHEEVNAWPCARLCGSFDFCNSLNLVCRFRKVGFLSVRLCLFVLCIFQKVERRRVPLYEEFEAERFQCDDSGSVCLVKGAIFSHETVFELIHKFRM